MLAILSVEVVGVNPVQTPGIDTVLLGAAVGAVTDHIHASASLDVDPAPDEAALLTLGKAEEIDVLDFDEVEALAKVALPPLDGGDEKDIPDVDTRVELAPAKKALLSLEEREPLERGVGVELALPELALLPLDEEEEFVDPGLEDEYVIVKDWDIGVRERLVALGPVGDSPPDGAPDIPLFS